MDTETDEPQSAERDNPFPPIPPTALSTLMARPAFQALPYERRRAALTSAISAVYDFTTAHPEASDAVFEKFGQVASRAYAKLDETHTLTEKTKEAGGKVLHFAKGMAQDIGMLGMGAAGLANRGLKAVGMPDKAIGMIGGPATMLAEGANAQLAHGFALGAARYIDSANHLNDVVFSDKDNTLKDALGGVREQIDTGKAPVRDPARFASWLQKESMLLLRPQQDWTMQRLSDYSAADPNAAFELVVRNQLSEPHNAGLLAAYVRTRDPQVWEQLQKNLVTTPLLGAFGREAEAVTKSAAAQRLDSVFGKGAAEHILSASDPLMIASYLLPGARAAMAGKAAIAGAGVKAAVKGIAKGLPEQAALGAATTLGHDPEASAGEVVQSAADMMTAGAVLHGAASAVGGGIRAVRAKTGGAASSAPSAEPPAGPITAPSLDASMASVRSAGEASVPPETPVITPPTATDPAGTLQERPETLLAQAEMVTKGTRPSMLFPGTSADAVPPELQPQPGDGTALHETSAGTFRYNPELIDPDAIDALVAADQTGHALGLGIGDKPEGAEQTVVLRGEDGTEKAAAATDAENAPTVATALAAQSTDPATDVVRVETPEETLAARGLESEPAPRLATPEEFRAMAIEPGDMIRARNLAVAGEVVGEGTIGKNIPAWQIDIGGGRISVLPKDQAELWSKPGVAVVGGVARARVAAQPAEATGLHVDRSRSSGELGAIDLKAIAHNLGHAGEGVKRFFTELGHIPKFTPFRSSVNTWVGAMQRSALAVRNLQAGIEAEVKDPLRREAITNYLQAGGDLTKLQAWEAASKGRTAEGYKVAQSLTPSELAVAGKIRKFYDDAGQLGIKAGVLKSWKADYVNKVWKDRLFGGKLSRTFQFGRMATHDNFFEGEQQGLIPATKDVSKLAGLYIHELHKTIATRKLIADLTGRQASDGRPLAAPLGGTLAKADPLDPAGYANVLVLPNAKGSVRFGPDVNGQPNMVDIGDYRRLNHPALSKWKFIDRDPDTGRISVILGELALHPEIHAHLKNALGESAMKEWARQPAETVVGKLARKTFSVVDHMNSFVKQTMLSISPFHVVQEGTHAVGHKVNPFASLERIDPDSPAHQDAMNHGLMLGGDEIAMRQFVEGVGGTPMLERVPGIGNIVRGISDFTFHTFIPSLKIRTYAHILARNQARFAKELANGTVTASDVKYLSARQTNNAYGHLNYKDLGRNPTFQHLMRLILLAPDFLEARATFTKEALTLGKVGREQRVALATLAATFYVSSRLLNAALNNGNPHWEEPFGVRYKNRIYTMRSVPEDIWKLLKDVRIFQNGRFAPTWGESGRKFLVGRMSPLISQTSIELATARNYRGEKVEWSETMGNAALKAIPISIQSLPGVRTLTQTTRHNPVSAWEQFAGSIGLHISRYSPITEVQMKAGKFAEAIGKPNTGSYPVSPYRGLRFALEDLDQEAAQRELAELAKTHDPKKLVSGFKRSLFHPYTGSTALDAQFVATLKGDDKAVFDLAQQRRVDVWNRFAPMVGAPLMSHPPIHKAR